MAHAIPAIRTTICVRSKRIAGKPSTRNSCPRGRCLPGQGPGLTPHDLGETGGSETVTLIESELPAHTHQLRASAQDASTPNGAGQMLAVTRHAVYQAPGTPVAMNPAAVYPSGGSGMPHNNLQPYLVLHYCIALQGVYPVRG